MTPKITQIEAAKKNMLVREATVYDFRQKRMVENNTCDSPQLIYEDP